MKDTGKGVAQGTRDERTATRLAARVSVLQMPSERENRGVVGETAISCCSLFTARAGEQTRVEMSRGARYFFGEYARSRLTELSYGERESADGYVRLGRATVRRGRETKHL